MADLRGILRGDRSNPAHESRSAFLLNQLAIYGVFGMLALSISLCWGFGGILNLDASIAFGLGAYGMVMTMADAAPRDRTRIRYRRSC